MPPAPESRRRIHWPRWPFDEVGTERAPNSLFLEILDWMLAPLLLLWPISIAVTNHYAHQIADAPYDGALVESVRALAQYVETAANPQNKRLPRALQSSLASDGTDTRYYRISTAPVEVSEPIPPAMQEMTIEAMGESPLRRRRTLLVAESPYDLASAEIPLVERPIHRNPRVGAEVVLRDDMVEGEEVRVAYQFVNAPSGEALLVQVAETRIKREAHVARVIRGVLLPQFAIIPLAAVLTYFGLSRGLAPLNRLRRKLVERRPGDLSPMSADQVPEEVRPLLITMNEMMRRLEGNLQAQQRFIADAAHQMRTPLTGLKTQAELAADETDPVRLRHALRLIAESADRAAHLTNQLLMLARTEASYEKLHRFEPVDVRALARAVTIEWVERALQKDIDLAFDAGEWPLMTEGAPLLLRELLSNLVDNAIKYTPQGGRVTVRLRVSEFIEVEVEDNGIGIPAEERERVFERFYRVLGTEANGSGLGLPIVKEIADLHRARVEVLDGEGGGTLFRVSLARRGGDASPQDLRPS